MRKVLQINSVVNTGSTGRITEQISAKAIENGWESFVAYGRNSNPSSANLIRIGGKKDFYSHIFKSYVLGKHGLASKAATLAFIERVKAIQPDIIHLHNLHGYYINYEILFEFLRGFRGKILWTLHDCWTFTGHCTYFSDINCNKWISGCHTCPKVKNYPRSLILDTSPSAYFLKKLKFCNLENLHIVTVSNWLQGLVSNSFLQDYPIETISNGVNLSIFKPEAKNSHLLEKYGLSNRFVMLAASTTWTRHKGFADYIKLSALLNPDEVIVMVGLKEDMMKDLPSNIIGLPKTESQADLSTWYNMADVVLNLSTQETFGMTTAEGFACGKPTIVYNATASPELVPKEALGYIVEPGDVDNVYLAAKKIKANGPRFYFEACVSAAFEKYNMDFQFQKYVDLYQKLLAE